MATAALAVPVSALAQGAKDTSPGNSGEHKTVICHHAGPTKIILLTVDDSAVASHLAHGDTLFPCDDGGGGGNT